MGTVPVVSLTYSSSLNLEAVRASEMQIDLYRTTRGYIALDSIVTWMARALLRNGPVNTRDTRLQQWNKEVTQPASRQRFSKQISAQAQ
jgi:hypothetical protein